MIPKTEKNLFPQVWSSAYCFLCGYDPKTTHSEYWVMLSLVWIKCSRLLLDKVYTWCLFTWCITLQYKSTLNAKKVSCYVVWCGQKVIIVSALSSSLRNKKRLRDTESLTTILTLTIFRSVNWNVVDLKISKIKFLPFLQM